MAGTNTLVTIRGHNYCLELQYLVVSTLTRNSMPDTRCQNTFQSNCTCHKWSALLSRLPVATIREGVDRGGGGRGYGDRGCGIGGRGCGSGGRGAGSGRRE